MIYYQVLIHVYSALMSIKLATDMNLYGTYGEYCDTVNDYAVLSVYWEMVWPCYSCVHLSMLCGEINIPH